MAHWTKTDLTFKKLLGRLTTDQNKLWSEERGASTINVHSQDVWINSIPPTPPSVDTAVVKVYEEIRLCEDISVESGVNRTTWFATSYFLDNTITTPTDDDIQAAYDDLSSRLDDWIGPKYDDPSLLLDQGYHIIIRDKDSNIVPVSDASNWHFDYETGVLTFGGNTLSTGDVLADVAPFYLTGYRYIGEKGTNLTNTDGNGVAGAVPLWVGEQTLGVSIMTQEETHTINVDGNLTARTKNFRIPHPLNDTGTLVHGSLEGPENGIYQYGYAHGKGVVRVNLPAYFTALTGGNYHIFLTPMCDKQIRVYKQDQFGFEVAICGGSLNRLLTKNKPIGFNFFVIGSRIDAPLIVEPS